MNLTGLPLALFDLWLIVVGLCIGSFLNVVIARVPLGQSIMKPRSRCPKCGHMITWYENIPLFSWLFLRARCSSCKQPISARYPMIEVLVAALFFACRVRFGWDYPLVPALVLVCLLVALTFIDLDHWILPFELTIPGTVVGVLLAIPQGLSAVRDSAIGAAVGFLSFWAMEFVGEKVFKKEALGGGDKYLVALLGAFLGWRPLLGIVFLSSMQGAVVGLSMLAIYGRAGPAPSEVPPEPAPPTDAAPPPHSDEEDDWEPGPTNLPFGPWLSLAGLEILLVGPWLKTLLPSTTSVLLGFG